MTDEPLQIKFIDPDPKKLRASWKAAKAKHAAAIKAKDIKFKQELGPLLDKRAAQYEYFDRLRLARIKASNKVQRGGKAKPMTKAEKARVRTDMRAALKPLLVTNVTLREVAVSYQTKIAGLGDPAEEDLGAILKAIVSLMDQQIKSFNEMVAQLKR